MTVVYDLIGVQNRDHGERGIARYVLQLALALEAGHPDFVDQFLVHPHLPLPAGVEPLIASGKVVRADHDPASRRATDGGLFIAGSVIELQEPLEVLLPAWARTPAWRTAAVLYDLIPLRFADWYLTEPIMRYAYRSRVRSLASFDHLLAISQASADDAEEFLGVHPDRQTVIWAGADDRFRPPSQPHHEIADELGGEFPGVKPGYVMFPSGIERRKNVDGLFAAYAALAPALRARHPLVLVCRVNDHERHELDARLTELGIIENVVITGYVSDELLVRLYQGADLVVFPAIYEGYGLPVLEAMRCGAPVICSDSSSLREVQTDPNRRFDPHDVDAIATAMRSALHAIDAGELTRDQAPPDHSWERAADLTVEALRRESAKVRPGRRPRLGVVTPIPPQRSGIATYARRLLEPLTESVDITVFVGPESGDVEPIPGITIEPIRRLDAVVKGGGAFDELLYFMGNSSFHVEALELLRRHPGRVMFHDARMTGLYSEVHRLHPERLVAGSVGATLAQQYPHRYRPTVEQMTVIPPDQADRFGILMARGITEHATEVLVHSRYAAQLLHHDTGVLPTVIFPIPAPRVVSENRTPAAAVVSTFGIVAPIKAPDLLMEAIALVRTRIPEASLRFVGGLDEPYLRHLRSVADRFGVGEAVHFTGHVDDEAFDAEQAVATVAVQLRLFTNGESSAAVTELLAAGVPTVVSSEASMGELPVDVVRHVDPADGAASLAEVLCTLLEDAEERERLGSAGADYAAAHGFPAAAEVLRSHLFGSGCAAVVPPQ